MAKRFLNPSIDAKLKRRAQADLTTGSPLPGTPDELDVATLAYRLWVDRGCPLGSPDEDWLEAERELQSRRSAS